MYMYMCVYVCMYVYIYIYTYFIFIYIYTYTIYIYIYTRLRRTPAAADGAVHRQLHGRPQHSHLQLDRRRGRGYEMTSHAMLCYDML